MGMIIREYKILYDSSDSLERNKKEKEYLDYINEHIANLKKACELYFLPLLDETFITSLVSTEMLHNAIRNVYDNIDTHDASKFSDAEFDPYRVKYYPTQKEKNDTSLYNNAEEQYKLAWKHHYETNEHHPEHWVDRNDNDEVVNIRDMSLEAIVEMICDWEAMSLKFNGSTIEWYNTKADKEKEAMSSTTKDIVEELLLKVIHN